MIRHGLALLFLAGIAATLSAQSSVNFETYGDAYLTNNDTQVAGDFNNDGKPDLIQCCNGSTQMVFRAGNGDGTFKPPVVAYATPVSLDRVVALDVNGDGKLDLIAMAAQNPPPPPGEGFYYLTVWLGNGDGTFQAPQTYATSQTPQGPMVVGKFFGDGRVDAAAATEDGIDLFRNEGGGKFTLAKSIVVSSGTYFPQLLAGDFNGTGVSDLVAVVPTSNDGGAPLVLSVLWNDGKGNFTQQQLGSYTDPQLAVSRLNGDAMMDLLVGYVCAPEGVPNYQCAAFDAYYGQGNNSLFKRTLVTNNTQISLPNTQAIAGVDVNGDGYGDIVAFGLSMENCPNGCTTFPAGIFVWLGNADGSFQQTAQETITSNDAQLGPFVMADFNRDGMMDFVQAVPGDGGTSQYYINATSRTTCGTYTISPTVTVCQPVDNTYSPSPVRVQANGYDIPKITAMQEYVDNSLKYSEAVTSFNKTFDLSAGAHFLVTKGWDSSGRSFVADRTVTVYNGTPGAVCAVALNSAKICLPSGDTISSPVHILANGNTVASIPTAAQLYVDGKLVVNNQAVCQSGSCYGGDSYVQSTQNLAPGSHNLVFKVWDLAGKVYQAQKTINVN